MNGQEYLEALGAALSTMVPARERMEILRYYKEYIEEAGAEGEADVLSRLGDPEELARRLAREGGFSGGEAAKGKTGGRRWVLWLAVILGVVILVPAALVLTFSVLRTSNPGGGPQVEASNAIVDSQDPAVSEAPAVRPEAFSAVTVDIPLGDVTVRTGTDYEVSLTSSGKDVLGRAYTLEYDVKDGVLSVWGTPRNLQTALGAKLSGQVTITVPEGTALGKLELSTDLGDITLSGLSGTELDAETDLGQVTARSMGAFDRLTLGTNLGDVVFSGVLGVSTELSTDLGAITVDADCPESQCGYKLKSDLGEVKVNGRGRGAESSRQQSGGFQLIAETSLGSVEVRFAS